MKLKVGGWVLASIALSIFFSVPARADLSGTEVSQLYVSIFGRASEGEGNAFWQSQPDMATAASAMLDTDAAKDYFGANLNTNQAFIEHIYLNTLDKTLSDDFDGISYWVNMLDTGTSRGEAAASLVKAINDYAPGGLYYDPDDTTTIAAYNQFTNRVDVSDYMAETVWATPEDWETSTSFSHGLVVSDDPATVFAAMVVVNSFTEEPLHPVSCGAYIAPGVWKAFDCYNLAATGKESGVDPLAPSWELVGGYWQWGRKGPGSSQWYDTNTGHFAHGPTGPGALEANAGEMDGWDTSSAPVGAWSDDEKTVDDPCPPGYRLPTKAQWEGVIDNNVSNTVGTWNEDAANYSYARFFGEDLMLPAAGYRNLSNGELDLRGNYGYYWSSSEVTYAWFDYAWFLFFGSENAETASSDWRNGLTLRCISD